MGRFGNQLFQYAFARAYCERYGHELTLRERWDGELLFNLRHRIDKTSLPTRNELTVQWGEADINLHSYFQTQISMIYTKQQCCDWFKLSPEMLNLADECVPKDDVVVAHRRGGDYFGYGYPVISPKSYRNACVEFGLPVEQLRFVDEASPISHPKCHSKYQFIFDFRRLCVAPNLLRANSSFSWWAGTLSNGEVFSPVIDGLKGGVEHNCRFVKGNWPRLANLDYTTDLHLNETVH